MSGDNEDEDLIETVRGAPDRDLAPNKKSDEKKDDDSKKDED